MKNDLKISHIQLRALIVATMIGIGVVSLSNDLSNLLGKDGWILLVMVGAMLIPVFLMINYIFIVNPGKDYFQIARATLGNIGFTISMIIFLSYLIVNAALVVRKLSELIKAFLLHTTPIEIIVLLFIITSCYIASMEIDVIARAAYFVYPILLIFAGIFFVISLPTADFSNLLPAFQGDFTKVPQGISKSFFSFTGFEIMLFALPYVEDKRKALKSSFIALGTVTFIYVFLFLVSLTQFNLKQLQRQRFPLLMIAKSVDLPGYFLQNLDGVVMALWIVVIFSTFAPSLFGAGKILRNVFKTKTHKFFVIGLIPVIYYVAMIPQNFIDLQKNMENIYNILSFLSIIVVPFLIFIVLFIKRRRGR